VLFEGPWAFAPDPKDANFVLAITPRTKLHRDLAVHASSNSSLVAGSYELSLPARVGPSAGTVDPGIFQAKIDPKNLERVLAARSETYVIRIPKPDAYETAARARSRLGATYPPDPATEKDYATKVSLRYAVGSMVGFSLAGTPQRGTFNPLLLQIEKPPLVRFAIDPAMDDDPGDKCDTHSREAFRDLARLLNLTLYIDFPDNPSNCHDKDPQKSPAKADNWQRSMPGWLAARLQGVSFDQQSAEIVAGDAVATRLVRQLTMATIYLFARQGGDCKSAIIVLNTGP